MLPEESHFRLPAGILTAFSASSLFREAFGEVTRHVRHASGASVPAAKISLTNTATNAARSTVSTESGGQGPGIIGFDAEVHKQFRMPYKEGHVLQFRFEAFDALKHPNWH